MSPRIDQADDAAPGPEARALAEVTGQFRMHANAIISISGASGRNRRSRRRYAARTVITRRSTGRGSPR
jgi:predicted oxidoreductase